MTKTKLSSTRILSALGACSEAAVWAGKKSPKKAWEECDRGDWLLN